VGLGEGVADGLGEGLADGLGDGLGFGVADGPGEGVAVADGDGLGVAVGLCVGFAPLSSLPAWAVEPFRTNRVRRSMIPAAPIRKLNNRILPFIKLIGLSSQIQKIAPLDAPVQCELSGPLPTKNARPRLTTHTALYNRRASPATL
jgi:hypothetical protein